MSIYQHTSTHNIRPVALTSVSTELLQRQCACGQHTGGGECAECREKREGMMQRAAVNSASASSVPPIVHDVLNSPGQPLDRDTRAFMETQFGHDFSQVQVHTRVPRMASAGLTVGPPSDLYEREADHMSEQVMRMPATGRTSLPAPFAGYDFSQVRVHTDAHAAISAQAMQAKAYTVGRDITFGAGRYKPETAEGKRLIAHELTHVIQQQSAGNGSLFMQRQEEEKPPDPKDPFKDEGKQKHPFDEDDINDQVKFKSFSCGMETGSPKCCLDLGTGDPFCLSGDSIEDALKRFKKGVPQLDPWLKKCPPERLMPLGCCPVNTIWNGQKCEPITVRLPVGCLPPQQWDPLERRCKVASQPQQSMQLPTPSLTLPQAQQPRFGTVESLVIDHFDVNGADVPDGYSDQLDHIAQLLNNVYRDVRVHVEGHTDSTYTQEYNQGLSERRANSIRDELTSRGVDAARILEKSFGEKQLLFPNEQSDEEKARNRRVEVWFYTPPSQKMGDELQVQSGSTATP